MLRTASPEYSQRLDATPIVQITVGQNVFADVTHRYLKDLIDNGLGKRIMFGSDQMSWPEVIDIAVDTIQTADFLTVEQKADIFYNNAARFFRLILLSVLA